MMRFYCLGDADQFPNAEWAEGMDFVGTIVCPIDDGHQRPGRRADELSIDLPCSKVGDFIWTWYSECIVTERVADLLARGGFAGFELRPVTVVRIYRSRNHDVLHLV